jgi:xylulose-5-phosphate/fructose-6-phosphate phosphoketolase
MTKPTAKSPSRGAPVPARVKTSEDGGPLSPELLRKMDAYWRASNYLSVGQIYLLANSLLRKPLKREHIKPRLLGHWGTTPGLNFIYVHLNRVIQDQDLNMIYIIGPGHGGPALVAQAFLEGTYSEMYPNIGQDEEGMKRLFKQFSFPGGIPSHVAPETPGSIHEGGELGYALSHAYGAAFDNPDLIVACIVGDGEAETGRLAREQIPQSCPRRRGTANFTSERLQDRQSLFPCAHSARRVAEAIRGLRLQTILRRGQRTGAGSSGDGVHARQRHR